jgi:hypothetical protein
MQRAVIGFLPVLFLLLLAGTERAQDTKRPTPPSVVRTPPANGAETQPCPSVIVQAQAPQPIRDGQRVAFIANINGGDQNVQPVIVWSTSAGSIMQGQSTRRIEVDTTGAGSTPERELKVDIWVSGYAPECVIQASASTKVIAPATKFGEFGEVGADAFATNIKALADFLSQSPDNVYFIAYAGRTSERGFTFNWIKRIKDALVGAGVPANKIIASDGGFREQPLFDFWIVPNGAEPPRATPTVKRTEIVYPKTTPPKKP